MTLFACPVPCMCDCLCPSCIDPCLGIGEPFYLELKALPEGLLGLIVSAISGGRHTLVSEC